MRRGVEAIELVEGRVARHEAAASGTVLGATGDDSLREVVLLRTDMEEEVEQPARRYHHEQLPEGLLDAARHRERRDQRRGGEEAQAGHEDLEVREPHDLI